MSSCGHGRPRRSRTRRTRRVDSLERWGAAAFDIDKINNGLAEVTIRHASRRYWSPAYHRPPGRAKSFKRTRQTYRRSANVRSEAPSSRDLRTALGRLHALTHRPATPATRVKQVFRRRALAFAERSRYRRPRASQRSSALRALALLDLRLGRQFTQALPRWHSQRR